MFSVVLEILYAWDGTTCLEVIFIFEQLLYDCNLIQFCTNFLLMSTKKLSLTVSPNKVYHYFLPL
jgi:hypothetical protein